MTENSWPLQFGYRAEFISCYFFGQIAPVWPNIYYSSINQIRIRWIGRDVLDLFPEPASDLSVNVISLTRDFYNDKIVINAINGLFGNFKEIRKVLFKRGDSWIHDLPLGPIGDV